MIQMSIEGVRRNFRVSSAYTYAVTLLDETRQHLLNIAIERQEALAIVALQHNLPLPRPLTIHSMANALKAFNVALEAVRIERMQPAPFAYFCAVARLRNGDTVQELDIRPSDALSLVLLMEGPIFVSNALLEQSGIVLSEDQTPELYFAEQLLKQEGIALPEGKKLRLGYSKTPACDALIKEFKAALLGKPQLFPEQDLEQAKNNYLSFILGTNNFSPS